MKRWIGVTAVAGVALAGLAEASRRRYANWGATEAEVTGPMPLDERVPNARLRSTRGITISAPAEDVWPWLVQMGEPPRGGYHSYTSIERLMGLDVKNAERVLPEFQELHVGEQIDHGGTMLVQAIDPGRYLVLGPPPDVDWMPCTWAFALKPVDEHQTRLLTRVRAHWRWAELLRHTPPWLWPMWLVMSPGILIMERKMLLTIRRKAERLAGERRVTLQSTP